jgi:hypothetical protein
MTSVRRWMVVGAGVLLLVAGPLIVRAMPVHDRSASAVDLLEEIAASRDAGYSGYVESLGTLQLPITDRFTDLGDLFGGRTRLRVWWSGEGSWRVDKLAPTGEIDTFHSASTTTTWDYERMRITRSEDPAIRLPQASDLLPPELATRLLDDVAPDKLTRLPAARLAGRTALGLRVRPSEPASSIDRVDLWADDETGIPLRVEVYAKGGSQAAVTSSFMDFSPAEPDADVVTPPQPADADYDVEDVIDIADAANRFAPLDPPPEMAGLARSSDPELRAVGVYGSGVTQFVAIPLWPDAADPLRARLEVNPRTQQVSQGDYLQVGPLGILLTKLPDCSGWLLAGTVTRPTLITAAGQLDEGTRLR